MSLPSEHAEQVTFVQWFEEQYPGVLIFAIPNGGYRAKSTAEKLKAEGVKRGIPDLFVPEWITWVEMKRQNGGRLSPEQKEKIEYLTSIGHTVIVGRGWEDAAEQIKKNRP